MMRFLADEGGDTGKAALVCALERPQQNSLPLPSADSRWSQTILWGRTADYLSRAQIISRRFTINMLEFQSSKMKARP